MIAAKKMIKLLDKHTIEISLPNELGYERVAMECSASFARIVGFLPERIEDLKTAVSEACTNAIEHGNRNHPNTRVIVNMNYRDHVFIVTVKDQGEGIENHPEIFKKQKIDKQIEGVEPLRGLGLFLIEQLVDQVEFNQITNGGHRIKMVFNLTK